MSLDANQNRVLSSMKNKKRTVVNSNFGASRVGERDLLSKDTRRQQRQNRKELEHFERQMFVIDDESRVRNVNIK